VGERKQATMENETSTKTSKSYSESVKGNKLISTVTTLIER